MILFFLPSVPITEKILKVAKYVPFLGNAAKFTRKSQKIYKVTNPIKASSMGVARVIDLCGGPVIKYPVLCGIWASSLSAGLITGNPTLLAIALLTFEKCPW